MADASGSPTSPDSIPTYNTSVDAPSGNGFNTAMTAIQTIITQLKAGTLASGKIAMAALNASGTPSSTTFLRGDGIWTPATATTYRKTSSKTVNTTTAATDLLNGEITVAANAMGASGLLRLTAWGDWKQNSGGTAVPPRFQLLFGASTVFDTGTSGTLATNAATRAGWRLVFELMNEGTGFQVATCNGSLYCPTTTPGSTAFSTGEGTYASFITSSAGMAFLTGFNTTTVDTTAAKALVLNVINGSASATYETSLAGAIVEVV